MSLDMDKTISDMGSAAAVVLGKEWGKVKECVEKALADEKEALTAIAGARIAGEINDAEMKAQIEDEKVALKAALLVCKVKAKMTVQKTVNAAMNVLQSAVQAALRIG